MTTLLAVEDLDAVTLDHLLELRPVEGRPCLSPIASGCLRWWTSGQVGPSVSGVRRHPWDADPHPRGSAAAQAGDVLAVIKAALLSWRAAERDWHRVTCFATDARTGQLADLELRHRRRARCEDWCAKDTGLRNHPLHGFAQNQIWCELVAMACELLAWMAMLAAAAPVLRHRTDHPRRPQGRHDRSRQRALFCTDRHGCGLQGRTGSAGGRGQ